MLNKRIIVLLAMVSLAFASQIQEADADDSNIRCWGYNGSGQCTVPSGVGEEGTLVTAVAAGPYHTVALLEDGSIRCWGGNVSGQCDVPSGVGDEENPVMSIAAGRDMTIALLAPPSCSGDLTGDDLVDGADLNELLGLWGACVTDACPADLDGNGQVDGADLLELLSAWGPCP